MSDSQFVRIKSLNIKSMRGVTSRKSVIRVAAMHNLREIQAELGVSAKSGINPARMALNYRIRGCDTAAAVASTAQALLDNADVKDLRKDAIMALEIIFSLPADSLVDQREFFAAAVAWTDAFFNVPILSAVVHLDEGAPHCHVLLLPLVAGCMRGGTLAGGPSKIKMMHADFQREVGQRFGLMHQPRVKGISKANRDAAGRQVLDLLKSHPERLTDPAVCDALVQVLGQHHATLLPLLGLELPIPATAKSKSFVDIMTAPCKPERLTRARASSVVSQQKSIDVAPSDPNPEPAVRPNVYLRVEVQYSATDSLPNFQHYPAAPLTPTCIPRTLPTNTRAHPSVRARQTATRMSPSGAIPISLVLISPSDQSANADHRRTAPNTKRMSSKHDNPKHPTARSCHTPAMEQTELVTNMRSEPVRLQSVAGAGVGGQAGLVAAKQGRTKGLGNSNPTARPDTGANSQKSDLVPDDDDGCARLRDTDQPPYFCNSDREELVKPTSTRTGKVRKNSAFSSLEIVRRSEHDCTRPAGSLSTGARACIAETIEMPITRGNFRESFGELLINATTQVCAGTKATSKNAVLGTKFSYEKIHKFSSSSAHSMRRRNCKIVAPPRAKLPESCLNFLTPRGRARGGTVAILALPR